MKTMCTIKNIACLSALVPAMMLSGCGDLAFVRPTDKQAITGPVSPGATTVDVPIEIDFTGSTSARNIVLDGNLNITTAPAAGFITTPGGGQNGWDRMSGKYTMAPGNHSLTASAEYLDYTRTTQTISKTVKFATLPPDLWPVVDANPSTANVAQNVTFSITVYNVGQSDAQNVSILFWTAVPAYFITVQPTHGFSCYMPSGYFPRFGMQCDGGVVAQQDTANISVVLSFPSVGSKVLAVFADPSNTIIESDETNNDTNTTVVVH
jgi:hypothetical protein